LKVAGGFSIVRCLSLLIALLLLAGLTQAQPTTGRVELVEHLGEKIPLNLTFNDASGTEIKLSSLIDRPTLIVPVYYDCRSVCNFMLGGLSQVLPEIRLTPGEDFRVLAISIDPEETVALAAHNKKTYLTAIQAPFPKDAWRFLTGTQENILQLTDALGYYFMKEGEEFLHPVAAIVVSGDGTIIRYLIGQRFMALDLSMAFYEASEGRIGTPIRKALEFCFSYDPEGRRYVFNLLRVSGTVILLTLGSFLLFLILSGRKKKK
jgi:protein SCO1/2